MISSGGFKRNFDLQNRSDVQNGEKSAMYVFFKTTPTAKVI